MTDVATQLQALRQSMPGQAKGINNLRTAQSNFVHLVRLMGGSIFGGSGRPLTLTEAIKQSAFLVCLDVLSQDIAKPGLRLKRRDGEANIEVKPNEHWLALLLATEPNRWHTWYEYIEMTVLHLGVLQNAFSAKVMEGRTGEASELLPILPGRLRTLIDESNWSLVREVRRDTPYEKMMFRHFGGTPDTETFFLREDQCIHFRGRLFDGLNGYSNLDAGSNVLTQSKELQDYRTRLFKNDGSLRGVFQMDNDKTLSNEAFERLRGELGELMRGVREDGDPIVLEEGLKFAGISMKANETEVSEAFNDAVVDVARIFRMPPHKIMHLVAVKYENLETLEKSYVNDTLIPYCQRIEQRLARSLLDPDERQTYFLEFDREALTLTDAGKQAEMLKVMLQNTALTVDEARKRRGLNPVGGAIGGSYQLPANTRLIAKDGTVIVDAGGTNSPKEEGDPEDGGADDDKGIESDDNVVPIVRLQGA